MNSVAQLWNGVLAPARSANWSNAGAGLIPDRTTTCSTLNPGVTASQINTAIANCSASGGGVVLLTAGTYSNMGQIVLKNNVTLQGAGPDQTTLVFSSSGSCNGPQSDVCFQGSGLWSGGGYTSANWTGSYAQGATSLTLSSTSGLQVGSLLIVDQVNDSSDPGDIYVCGNMSTCGWSGNTVVNGRPNRAQAQMVTVTSISGSTVGISPGLYAPNWNRNPGVSLPQAWWATQLPITGAGIEALTLDHRNISSLGGGIVFMSGSKNWVKNIASLGPSSGSNKMDKHILFEYSAHNTVRDSYFYGSQPTSEGYGIDFGYISSDNLGENNIFQHLASATITEGGMGNVYGYNYAVDNYFGSTWQQQDGDHHSVGDAYLLWESNIGSGYAADGIHGGMFMLTTFRNRWSGRDTATENGAKTQSTIAFNTYALSRYVNSVGNVLGTFGYHNTYQTVATTASSNGTSTANTSVYVTGFSGSVGGINGSFPDDPMVATTLMRWGNYDTVTGTNESSSNDTTGIRFVAAENASSAAVYPGLSSPSQILPASFYLNSKPSWWAFPNGNANTPWPAIGPDVTSGNIANVGGHAYLTPAANCYLKVMGGLTDGTSGILTFNADNCYGSGSGGGTPPAPPSGLSAVVQ